MLSQIHMAKSAMFALQRKMQVIANNVSNSQTVGFKSRRVEMESLFPLVFEGLLVESDETVGAAFRKRRKYVEMGQGVRIADVDKDFEVGTIEITNQPLHMAIDGQGLFQVRMPDGTISYTRAGNFHLDSQGNLVTPNGHQLEPSLRIPDNTVEVIINEEGRVFAQVGNEVTPQEIGQITLARFTNYQGLRDVGQNLYTETAASGEPYLEVPGRNGVGAVRQRALEFSNVNVIEELVNMLLTQRSYETVVKAIKAADDMLKTGGDLGK